MKGVHCQISAIEDAGQRRAGIGEDGLGGIEDARRIEATAQHAEGAVHHQQEHHAGDGGRHHQRQGHQRAQHAVALAVGVEQQRDQQAQHQLDDDGDDRIEIGVADGTPHAVVGEDLQPVVIRIEDTETGRGVALVQRKPERVEQRIDAEDQQHRGDRRQPGNGCSDVRKRGKAKPRAGLMATAAWLMLQAS